VALVRTVQAARAQATGSVAAQLLIGDLTRQGLARRWIVIMRDPQVRKLVGRMAAPSSTGLDRVHRHDAPPVRWCANVRLERQREDADATSHRLLAVRHPIMVEVGRYYGLTLVSCVPADSCSLARNA
jgi:hypothetical protein